MSSGSIGYIPYSEITGWLDENDIEDKEDRREYRFYINYIDKKYVEETNDGIKRKIDMERKKNARK